MSEFALEHLLHESTGCRIYRAVRASNGHKVVLKITPEHDRLKEELALLERLDSGHVVRALGLGQTELGPALVLEDDGMSSAGLLVAPGGMPLAQALTVALGTARGLADLHANAIVHRDVKPSNLLFDPNTGAVKLLDLGGAASLPSGEKQLPPGPMVGTAAYISPEQTGRTAMSVDGRSDLYGLGVSLYELLAGKLPFSGDEMSLVAAHLAKSPPRLAEVRPGVPEVVSDLVARLMNKEPDDRYQTASGLAADLERCLDALSSDDGGDIESFQLGRDDPPPRSWPDGIFGREVELMEVDSALDRARGGTPQVVIVRGREGSGREAFVQFLLGGLSIDACAGRVANDAARSEPLRGLCLALDDLAQRLLLRDEKDLSRWRERLSASMGSIGAVLTQLAPSFEHILGPQPPLETLGPAETKARFKFGLEQALRVLGQRDVCVLFFGSEDVDDATGNLLQQLAGTEGLRLAFVISVNECPDWIEERPAAVVELGALESDTVVAALVAAFGFEPDIARPLGEMVFERTQGYPGSVRAFVESLVESGVISWQAEWHFDLDAVARAELPATATAMVGQAIAELDEGARMVLLAAASTPVPQPFEALAAWTGVSRPMVAEIVPDLLRRGLLRRGDLGVGPSHPRVTELALESVDPARGRAVRQMIGRHLVARLDEHSQVGQAFAILCLLGEPRSEDEPALCGRVGALALHATEAAMSSSATKRATALAQQGLAYLRATPEPHEDVMFSLRVLLGSALALQAETEAAESVFLEATKGSLRPEQITEVAVARIENLSSSSRDEDAVRVGLAELQRLGLRLPANPSVLRPIPRVLVNQRRLEKLGDGLRDLPDCTDERAVAISTLMTKLIAAAYTTRPNLYLLGVEVSISMILDHGLTPDAPALLGNHASVVELALKRSKQAYDLTLRALELLARRPARHRGYAELTNRFALAPFYEPIAPIVADFHRAERGCFESGEPANGVHLLLCQRYLAGYQGEVLSQSVEAVNAGIKQTQRIGNASARDALLLLQHVLRPLVDGASDEETETAIAAAEAVDTSKTSEYFGFATVTFALLADRRMDVLRRLHGKMRRDFAKVCMAAPIAPDIEVAWSILDAEVGDARGVKKQQRAIRARQRRIPGAFDRHQAFVEAELHRLRSQVSDASDAYGRAAAHALKHGALHILAVAHERRADLLSTAGRDSEAQIYYREAHAAYRRWGHARAVRRLETSHPTLGQIPNAVPLRVGNSEVASRPISTRNPSDKQGSSEGRRGEDLDLGTVLKVGRQISRQLEPSGVVRAVLEGVAENAGADRAVLILAREDDLWVESVLVGGHVREVQQPLDVYEDVTRAVVRSTYRRGEAIVIADARIEGLTGTDDHVRRTGLKALAVVPVASGGRQVGVVVLENSSLVGAFTTDRVRVVQALATQAAISLDNANLYRDMRSRVEQRTAQLDARNHAMRLVLDNISQALVVVDREGKLSTERSATLDRWFGSPPDTIVELIDRLDPRASGWFEAAWEMWASGGLPAELCLAQLPEQIRYRPGDEDRTFGLEYEPIDGAEEVDRILVVMTDITDGIEQERLQAKQQELGALFEHLGHSARVVADYRRDSGRMVDGLAARAADALEKRWVHTLKGNSATLGQHRLATLCHEIESSACEECRAFTEEEIGRVVALWKEMDTTLQRLVGADETNLRISRDEFTAVVEALEQERHPVAPRMQRWAAEPLQRRLERSQDAALALSKRLGKEVRVHIEVERIDQDPELWQDFWAAFVHVVRNAIDHGIEPTSERGGKPGCGNLFLTGVLSPDGFVLSIRDDGRGIDWARLRTRLNRLGLPASTHEHLVAGLFHDGVSTNASVTELSGRGVGLAAVRAATEALGGAISVESKLGSGTSFRFTFPVDTVLPPLQAYDNNPAAA